MSAARDQVELRRARPADVDLLQALRNDFEMQRQMLARPRPHTREMVVEWFEKKAREPGIEFFVIAERNDGAAIGYLQFAGLHENDRAAELGICLAPAARGRGLAAAAIDLGEATLERDYGIRKLWLRVRADNAAAIRSYERAGFKHCGRLTRHVIDRDREVDVLFMERFVQRGSCES